MTTNIIWSICETIDVSVNPMSLLASQVELLRASIHPIDYFPKEL